MFKKPKIAFSRHQGGKTIRGTFLIAEYEEASVSDSFSRSYQVLVSSAMKNVGKR